VVGTPRLDLPASHWSKRAEEARTLADRAVTEQIRLSWVRVAENYEFLTRQVEARTREAEARSEAHCQATESMKVDPVDSGR
jgi:hypothetical protein